MLCLPFQCFWDPNIGSFSLPQADWGRDEGEFKGYSVSAESWVLCWGDNDVHGSLRVHLELYVFLSQPASFLFFASCIENCGITCSSPKCHEVFCSLHIGCVCLSGLYHTRYFQRLSSDSLGNKHLTTRRLLKQGKSIWDPRNLDKSKDLALPT